MMDRLFNLADEPWIRVMTADCSVHEVSLTEALTEAHAFKKLSGEMEAQNVALLRLLVAVTHTVFSRVNPEGDEEPVETAEEALRRWQELHSNGRMPEKPIREYLKKWHDRFWLFDPERPFYQALSAENGTENTAAKLNGSVSESNNKARLFASISGEGKKSMTWAESARWLLFLNGFDDCAAKQRDKSSGSRSMSVAWLGKLGLITASGENLYETILLNMPMLIDGEELWPEEDLPVWEKKHPNEEERRTIEMPQNLAELMTLQSRRLMLIRDEDRVTGYKILGGDAFPEQNALSEPMTLWRYLEDKKEKTAFYVPKRHDRSRQIWRDFGAMVNYGDKEKRPGVVSWCSCLQRKRLLPRNRMLTFRISCVRYDSSQFSSITDSFSDELSFHADLLLDAGKEWIREINRQIGLIELAAQETGRLAINLGKASGSEEVNQRAASDTAKEQFYLSMDAPFRDWLSGLEPDQESEKRLALITEWQQQARRTAMALGRRLAEEAGEAAFVGRMVKENKKEYHYSTPEAYRWFRLHLNEIYPYAQEGDEKNG